MPERVAILVIHGIGQQKPYETLDQFTRNLLKNFGSGWTVTPQLDQAVDPTHVDRSWVRTSYRISPPAGLQKPFESDSKSQIVSAGFPQPSCSDSSSKKKDITFIKDITLFEYYWAPITQGKITYRGSLYFLIRAGLTPFLFLVSNINVIRQAGGGPFIWVLLKEIFRQLCLFLPLLAILVILLFWLSDPSGLLAHYTHHLKTATAVTIGFLALRYLYLISTVRTLRQTFKIDTGWRSRKTWKLVLFLTVLIHIFAWPLALAPVIHGIASGCAHISHHLSDVLANFAAPLHFPYQGPWRNQLKSLLFFDPSFANYTVPVLLALLVFWLRNILTNLVGDIAVYCNSDTFASSYAARTQILEECSAALTAILKENSEDIPGSPKYDRVLIAAHSLGSVIAYDTMNQLLNVARTAAPGAPVATTLIAADLDRLRGLVTFGCPLNKIFYFFRPLDSPQLTLRAQTLNLLHGFRLKTKLMRNAEIVPKLYPFQPPPSEPLAWKAAEEALEKGFTWINAYSPMDPISGNLIFYCVDAQKSINHLPPLVAHVRYWEDQSFYEFVRAKLL